MLYPARRNISAAARWNPSGRPAVANVAAISSISPIQRQPFASADRAARHHASSSSGNEIRHSSTSSASTPSASATARIASSNAAVPFVQAAYVILSAEASPTVAETGRASTDVPSKSSATVSAPGPERYKRVVPALLGGGPMIPPSTNLDPTSAEIARADAGAMALPSTKIAAVPATERATSLAA